KKIKMHEVRTIILDECDQLLNQEHLDTVRTIVKSALNDRQLLLFSATELKEVDLVTVMIGRKPELVRITKEVNRVSSNVDHYYLLCEPRDRTKLLQKIAVMDQVKALVFVRDVGNMNVL